MASERLPYSCVTNAPGLSRIIEEELRSYREHKKVIVEFTLAPTREFQQRLGRWNEFKISFEVALRGTTVAMGHQEDEPSNIRFLGRFLTSEPLFDYPASALTQWQWEVVFNPQTRKGMVFKLDQPLPEEWTR